MDEGGRPGDWLKSFEEGFLGPLDTLARRRIEEHAWQTFKATAASPNGGVDAVVTLSSGSSMLDELGRIYDLHIGRVGAAVLLARLLVNNDLAGGTDRPVARGEAVIEPACGEGSEIDEYPRRADFAPSGAPSRSIPSRPKSRPCWPRGLSHLGCGEAGLVHYFLMRRLGARAIRLLQPITPR